MTAPQINIQAFIDQLTQGEEIFVLDVREEEEYRVFNIEGYLIPLGQLSARLDELPHNKPIVVHCRSGHRSQAAVEFLQKAGFSNVRNLAGGILAWQEVVGTPKTLS